MVFFSSASSVCSSVDVLPSEVSSSPVDSSTDVSPSVTVIIGSSSTGCFMSFSFLLSSLFIARTQIIHTSTHIDMLIIFFFFIKYT